MNHDIVASIAKNIGTVIITVKFDEEDSKFQYLFQIKDTLASGVTLEDAFYQFLECIQEMRLTRAEHAAVDRALGMDREAAEEAERQRALDQEGRRHREDQRRAVPGVADLEDFLGSEVEFSSDMDEDGPSGLVRASIVVGGVGRSVGLGATDSAAVAVLRGKVAHALREIASDLELPPEE